MSYAWRWSTCDGKYPELGRHRGQRCEVVARGALNSGLVRFADGAVFVTSRNGIRKERVHGE